MHQDGYLERQKHIAIDGDRARCFFCGGARTQPMGYVETVRIFGILGAHHPVTVRDLLGVVAVLVPLSGWGNSLPLLLLLLIWSKVGCGCCGTVISCTMVTVGGSSCTVGLSSRRSFPPFLSVFLFFSYLFLAAVPIRVGGREGALARRPVCSSPSAANQSIDQSIDQLINQSINRSTSSPVY